MNYSMLEEARELAGWSKESEALSMYEMLSNIEDRRGKPGKRYGLALLFTYLLLAKMAGETTLLAIAGWKRFRMPGYKKCCQARERPSPVRPRTAMF